MKYIPVLTLSILTIFLSACGGSSKPSKQDMQKAMFQKDLPYITFHKFEANIVENPELAKQNKYEAYIDAELSYSEPLYVLYNLKNPFGFRDSELMPLRELAFENQKLLRQGRQGLSRVLWEVYKKNHKFKISSLVSFLKTERGWVQDEVKDVKGDEIIGGLVQYYEGKGGLIWGSPEHLAELAEHGLTLPGRI